MMKKNILGLCVISLLVFVGAIFVSAQEIPEPEMVVSEDEVFSGVMIADVNIYDARIVSQEENIFDISFDLANGKGAQAQVKYSVSLLRVGEGGEQSLIHEKVYDDEISISDDSSMPIRIEYTAPDYLSGTYQMWVTAQNKSGLMLALAFLGEVDLSGGGEYVEIVPESCFLRVSGESPRYTIDQGVDINANENLEAYCDVVNHFGEKIEVFPVFETRLRSSSGDVVKAKGAEKIPFVLASGEKRTVRFPLPKASSPQAYETRLALYGEGKEIVSNFVLFRYVLRGESATIQNVFTDKDYYKKGDVAKMSLSWSLSADSFPGSRFESGTEVGEVFLNLNIVNSEELPCAEPIKKEKLDKEESALFVIEIPVTKNCLDPKILAVLTDSKGNPLDEKEFFIKSHNEQDQFKIGDFIISIVIVFILLLIGFIISIKKKKIGDAGIKTFILVLALGGALFVSVGGAEAASFRFNQITYTANINKSVYLPGEIISVAGTGRFLGCSNAIPENIALYAKLGSVSKTIVAPGKVRVRTGLRWDYQTYKRGVTTLRAPSSPGDYAITIKSARNSKSPSCVAVMCRIGKNNFGTVDIQFTVRASPPTLLLFAPRTVAYDSSATLSWSAINAASCVASGSWKGSKPLAGSESTGNLTSDKSYTLTCRGPGGKIKKRVRISVIPPENPTLSLSASPDSVNYNSASTLSWTSSGATSCVASGNWSGSKPLAGSESTGNLTSDKNYSLLCSGPGGDISQSVAVSVNPPIEPTLSLSASPNPVDYDRPAMLSWTSSDTTSCSASGDWSGSKPLAGSESTGNLTSGKTYMLTCDGPLGSVVKSVTIIVSPLVQPSLSFSASPPYINYNSASTLSWSSSGVTSCAASGDWSGNKPLSGSESTGNLTSNKNYTLTCSGRGGIISKSTAVSITQCSDGVDNDGDGLIDSADPGCAEPGNDENNCGNSVCEPVSGENFANCPSDCTAKFEEF